MRGASEALAEREAESQTGTHAAHEAEEGEERERERVRAEAKDVAFRRAVMQDSHSRSLHKTRDEETKGERGRERVKLLVIILH